MSATFRYTRLAAVLVLCLLVTACIKNKVTKDNFDKIKEGMTLEEVEKILGKGTKEEGDGTGTAAQFGVHIAQAPKVGGGETYNWERGGKTITVGINQGKVVFKRSSGF